MAWLDILGKVLLALLEYGGLGLLCVLALLFALRKDKKFEECRIEMTAMERQHGKEKLQMERDFRKENIELLTQYEKTLISVQKSVDDFVEGEGD